MPKKILLIHLFSNGDCLYATTVVKQIKQDFPGCHLTWLISTSCSSMAVNNPDVDALWQIQLPASQEEKEQLFEQHIHDAQRKKQAGEYDEVFVTQILGDNFAKYDSCVATSIYRCYGEPITVDKTSVLVLTNEEIEKAATFAMSSRCSTSSTPI